MNASRLEQQKAETTDCWLKSMPVRTDFSAGRLQQVPNEKEMLRQVANGDERAFKELFKTYWPQVYVTAFKLTRSSEQARDLAQEIFIKVWKNRSQLAEVSRADAFLYVISKNFVIDFLRRKVFHCTNIDELKDFCGEDAPTAQEKLEFEETREKMNKAIDHLPARLREVFTLSRVEGLTHVQIASRLNISIVSSKTYIVRALQSIRHFIEKKADIIVYFAALFNCFL